LFIFMYMTRFSITFGAQGASVQAGLEHEATGKGHIQMRARAEQKE
jgi:hypothetical protein